MTNPKNKFFQPGKMFLGGCPPEPPLGAESPPDPPREFFKPGKFFEPGKLFLGGSAPQTPRWGAEPPRPPKGVL